MRNAKRLQKYKLQEFGLQEPALRQKDERSKMKCRQITELINRVNLTMPVKCKSHLDMAERAQFIRVLLLQKI